MISDAVLILLLSGAFLFGVAQGAPAETSPIEDRLQRLETQVMQERGRRLYREACAPCHGPGGAGANGPSLRDETWVHGKSLLRVRSTIGRGVAGTAMPSWSDAYPPGEILALADYVLWLSESAPADGS